MTRHAAVSPSSRSAAAERGDIAARWLARLRVLAEDAGARLDRLFASTADLPVQPLVEALQGAAQEVHRVLTDHAAVMDAEALAAGDFKVDDLFSELGHALTSFDLVAAGALAKLPDAEARLYTPIRREVADLAASATAMLRLRGAASAAARPDRPCDPAGADGAGGDVATGGVPAWALVKSSRPRPAVAEIEHAAALFARAHALSRETAELVAVLYASTDLTPPHLLFGLMHDKLRALDDHLEASRPSASVDVVAASDIVERRSTEAAWRPAAELVLIARGVVASLPAPVAAPARLGEEVDHWLRGHAEDCARRAAVIYGLLRDAGAVARQGSGTDWSAPLADGETAGSSPAFVEPRELTKAGDEAGPDAADDGAGAPMAARVAAYRAKLAERVAADLGCDEIQQFGAGPDPALPAAICERDFSPALRSLIDRTGLRTGEIWDVTPPCRILKSLAFARMKALVERGGDGASSAGAEALLAELSDREWTAIEYEAACDQHARGAAIDAGLRLEAIGDVRHSECAAIADRMLNSRIADAADLVALAEVAVAMCVDETGYDSLVVRKLAAGIRSVLADAAGPFRAPESMAETA